MRTQRARRLAWLDLHNVLGISTVAWVMVVAVTGFINSLHDPIAGQVRVQFSKLAASYRGAPPAARLSSLDAAIATTRQAAPDMGLVSLWFPGSRFSTPHHYAVFSRGNTPLSSRMLSAVLVDAESGRLADAPPMAWYAKALFVSQPLHFGDYGGLPLKILWALLDLVTIVVLVSGLVLWWRKRDAREPSSARLDDAAAEEPVQRTLARQPLRVVFRVPALLGVASVVGLLAALLGDGGWDALSWLMLAIPLVVMAVAMRRQATRRES